MARFDSEHGIDLTPSVEAEGATSLIVDNPYLLFNAEYSREGSDLVLSDDRGGALRLQNYFDNAEPADLVSPDGARLTGNVVETLAGPAFPGQIAQGAPGAAVAAGARAIGQVETVTGTATVQRADGTTETLSLGTQVFQNDVVATAAGGALSITFEDGTVFTLAAGSRMVLNELVYDPNGDDNGAVFNLVEGSFVFIAGQVAKTGGMEVITPVATMGIRGTTVRVDIETVNGVSTVDISLVRDPDGGLGNFTITGLDGSPIASVTGTETKWIISPVDGETREVPKLPVDLATDNAIIVRAVQAFESAQDRVRDGGEYVTGNQPGGQDQPDQGPDRPDGENPDGPDGPDDNRRGELGSGLETDVAGLDEKPGVPQIGKATETLAGDGPPLAPPTQTVGDEPQAPRPPQVEQPILVPDDVPDEAPEETGTETATGPSFTFPDFNGSVTEDGFVILTGFSFTDTGSPLTVTLVAGSTVTINPNSGVAILEGTGTNDERLVINGTAEQIEAALNSNSEGPGLTYRPSPNADGNGSLTITSSDGTSAVTGQLTLPIDPVQDAPSANDDAITRSEDDGELIGDLLLNDSDPDINPQPDVLTVTEVTYAGFPFIIGEPLVLANNAQITFLPNGLYVFEPGNNYQDLNTGETEVETFQYTLDDGNGNTDTATLTLTIEGSDDVAVIVGDQQIAAEEARFVTLTTDDLDSNDPGGVAGSDDSFVFTVLGNPGDQSFELASAPGEAVTSFTVGELRSGQVRYGSSAQVATGSTATDSVQLSLSTDGTPAGTVGTATVQVVVSDSGTAAPTALADDLSVDDGDGATTLNLLTNDIASNPPSALSVLTAKVGTEQLVLGQAFTLPTGGFVTILADGTLTFDPAGAYDGLIAGDTASEVVTYTITNEDGFRSTSNVTIEINGTDNFPVVTVTPPGPFTEALTGEVDTIRTFDLADAADATILGSPAELTVADGTVRLFISVGGSAGPEVADGLFTIDGSTVSFDSLLYNTLGDGGNTSFVATFDAVVDGNVLPQLVEFTITGVNDAPVSFGSEEITVDLGGVVAVGVGTLNAFDVDDDDAGLTITVTDPAPNGFFALGTAPDTELTSFTLGQLRGGSIVFNHDGTVGTDATITVSLADDGADGAEAQISVIDIITADTGNQDPTGNGVQATLTATEEIQSTLDVTSIVIADADADGGDVTVSFTSTNGTMVIIGDPDVVVGGTGNVATLTGTVDALNAYFAGASEITYQGPIDFDGAASIAVTINDNGNTGTGGGADVLIGTIAVTVNGVNDAPTSTGLVLTASGNEEGVVALDFSGLVVSDVDADGGELSVNFSGPIGGTLNVVGNGDVTVSTNGAAGSISGTVAQLNSYFASAPTITITGPPDLTGNAEVIVSLNDGGNTGSGGPLEPLIGIINVDFAPVNDDPTAIGVPTTLSAQEDASTTLNVDFFQITDVDAGSGDVTVTFTASTGAITIIGGAGVTVGGSGNIATLTGTVAAVNTYFSSFADITYQGPENFNGTATIEVTVNDNGNTGTGGGTDISLGTISVTVDAVDDAPEITITSPAPLDEAFDGETLAERQFNLLDTVSVSDIDSPGLASLVGPSVAFFESDSGSPGTPVAGGIFSISGDNVVFDGTAFDYLGDGEQQNFIATFDLDVDGNITSESVEFTITGSNDSPTISGTLIAEVTEGASVVLNDSILDGFDIDDDDANLTIDITAGPATGFIALNSAPATAITSFTVGQVRNGDVSFFHDGSEGGADLFDFQLSDDNADSVAPVNGTLNLIIDNTNDDPSATGTPTTLTASEDIQSTLDVSSIIISDVDAGSGDLTVTFTSSNGIIAIVGGAGVTVGGTGNVGTLTGTLSELNAYFAGSPEVTYTGPADFNGEASIDITVNDNGNTGIGGGTDISLGTVTVTVDAVNDDPTGTGLPSSITLDEDSSTFVDMTTFSIQDVDAGAEDVFVKLAASNGSLGGVNLGAVTATTDAFGDLTLTGPVADLNAYFLGNNISYVPDGNVAGSDSIAVSVNDGGNTGTGGGSDILLGSIPVTINSVNDDPIAAGLPTTLTANEDIQSTLDVSSIIISDVDAGAGDLTVTFTSSNGVIAIVGGAGVTVGGTGNVGTLTGTISELNAYFSGSPEVTYTGPADFNGAASIDITVNDNGNTGAGGGTDVALGTVSVTVDPVNDAPDAGALSASVNESNTGSSLISSVRQHASDIDNDTTDLILTSVFIEGTTTSIPIGALYTFANGSEVFFNTSGSFQFWVNDAYDELGDTETFSERFTYTLTDPEGLSDEGELLITINGTNDAPEITGDLTQNVDEGGTQFLDISDLNGTDVDDVDGALVFTVTSGPTNGTLIVDGSADTSFTVAQLRNGLVGYTHDGSETTSDSIGLSLADGGEAPGDTPDTATLNITVDAVNDDPTGTGLPVSVSISEDAEGSVLISSFQIDDVDAGSGEVTVTFTADTGSIIVTGGAGVTAFSSGSVGTLTGTVAALNTYFSSASDLRYQGTQDFVGADNITVTINDGGNTGTGGGTDIVLGSIGVDVVAFNDDPTATGLPTTLVGDEDVQATLDVSNIIISDVDAGTGDLTVTFSAPFTGTIAIVGGAGVTVGGTGNVGTLTGTLAELNAYFAGSPEVTYTGPADINGVASISITVNDGGNTGTGGGTDILLGSVGVTLNPVNDDPSGSGLNSAQTVDEDVTTALDFTGFTLTDVDAGTGDLTINITPATGSISVIGDTGITVGTVGSTVTVTGTLDALNAYFGASPDVFYTGPAEFSGDTTIDVTVNDNGNTGTGGGTDIELGTITVTVDPVNDAPVATFNALGADVAVNGGFETGPADGVPSVQVEAGSTTITNWTVVSGNVDHVDTAVVADEGNNVIDLHGDRTGSIATQLNTQIGATYVVEFAISAAAGAGEAVRDVEVSVNGDDQQFSVDTSFITAGIVPWVTESVVFTAATTTTSLSFASLDANSNNGVLLDDVVVREVLNTGLQNGSTTISGLSIADIDADGAEVEVQLSSADGLITIANIANGIPTAGVSTGGGITTITATIDEINTTFSAPNGVIFTPDNGFSGLTELNMQVDDLGNTGALSSPEIDTTVGFIYVEPVPSPPTIETTSASFRTPAVFDGSVSNYAISNAVNEFPASDFAVSLRFQDAAFEQAGAAGFPAEIYLNYHVSNNEEFAIGRLEDGRLVIGLSQQPITTTDPLPFDADFHHLTVNFNFSLGTLDVYVDGELFEAGLSMNGATSLSAGGLISLGVEQDTPGGGFDPVQTLNGSLDDVAIWDALLSPTDILNIARGEAFAASPPVLTAQWDGLSGAFVNGSGSTTFTTNGMVGTGPTFAPMTEDGSLVFRDFQVADGDGPDEVLTMVLTAPTGTFTVFSSDGIFGSAISNNNTGTVTVEGTRADINDWLQNHGFRYQSPADFFGDVDISIDVTDSFALTDTFPLTINVLAVDDPAMVSGTTDPANLVEGDQGVVSIASIDLNSTFTASDPDGAPMIDPDSITIVDGLNPGFAGSSQLFYVEGDEVKLDTGLLDALQTGSSIDAVVFFDVVSGPETFSRSITITVDGVTDSTINFVEGSSARDVFTPTTGDDFFVSAGNTETEPENLFGENGNDILIGSDEAVGERFDGGDGDDAIFTGSNSGFNGDFSTGSRGSDRYYFTGNGNGYQSISYAALTGGLVATISAATNTATIDKGAGEIDTIIDVAAAVYSEDGGFGLYGSGLADTFNIDNGPITDETQFMQVGGGSGNDVYNLISGNIRLDLRHGGDFEQPDTGVQINLSLGSNQIINDGFGGTDTITGPGTFSEIRTTDLDDSIIGSAADEQFIARQGNDIIDGGGGFDTIRYDRPGAASVELDLATNSSVGIWGDGQFSQTLTSIEGVRGSNIGVDTILGSTADNRLEGRGGTDIVDGRDGNDTLNGGDGGDIFIVGGNSGEDVIEDFDPSSGDRIVFNFSGVNAIGDLLSVSFDGTNTFIEIDGSTNTLTLENFDLTTQATPEDFLTFSADFGGVGDETLTGTTSNDALFGNSGDDTLLGLDGDDILVSGRGVQDFSTKGETLDGGAGNDLLIGGTFSAVRLIGGAGDDQLMAANVSFSDDATRWFEWVVFDYSQDPSSNGIIANLTDGTFAGVAASSVRDGYLDTDSVTGVRTIYDSAGDDQFRIDGTLENSQGSNRVEVDLSSGGNDTVDFTGAGRGRVSFVNATEGVNAVLGGNATDVNTADGNSIGVNTFTGATEIKGSDFDDLLTGDTGDNRFQGRGGDDRIDGGGGIDSADYWSARDFVTVDLELGTDQAVNDGFGGTDELVSIRNINGGLTHDKIEGNNLDNVLNGYTGNDVLNGRGGSDILIGDEGSAAGISGGNDTLISGFGNNVMTGGDGSDVFYMSSGFSTNTITDFSLAAGDFIDVSEFGFFDTSEFVSLVWDIPGNRTVIEVEAGKTINVEGVNLLTAPNIEDLFIFQSFVETEGNDSIFADGDDGTWYRPLESNPNFGFDQLFVEFGSFTFDYSFSRMGEQRVSYSAAEGYGITADLDAINNTGTILKDGGVEGTDAIFNIQNAVSDKTDGFHLFGTESDDSFTIDNGDNTWMEITALEGNNSFQVDSGVVRVNYSFNFVSPIVANLVAGTITHSAGNTDTVTGALGVTEIVGTRDTDTFIGTANDESFVGLSGDDQINGGGGFDRIRYDLVGDTSELDINLTVGFANGAFDEDGFSHDLTSIEWVTGSINDDEIDGSDADERFDGMGGFDGISGGGGNDLITVPDVAFGSLDGEAGQDILRLDAGGIHLDLSVGGAPTVSGFETVDLVEGNGETQFSITDTDVAAMSTEGNAEILAALGITENSLLVNGDQEDILNLVQQAEDGGSWAIDATGTNAFDGYDVFTYTNGGTVVATVAVDEDVQTNVFNIS